MANLLMAIGHPLNVVMFFASILAGLLADWRLIPIGLALWLVMVISVALNPSDKLNSSVEKRSYLSQRFQPLMSRIQRSQVNLFNTIEGLPEDTKAFLKPVHQGVDQLAEKALLYCQRLTPLENYRLVSLNSLNYENEKQKLESRLNSSNNQSVRAELNEALNSLNYRKQTFDSANAHLDKAEAVLTSLANELDATLLEVMQLPSLEKPTMKAKIDTILQKLKTEISEVDEIGKIPSANLVNEPNDTIQNQSTPS